MKRIILFAIAALLFVARSAGSSHTTGLAAENLKTAEAILDSVERSNRKVRKTKSGLLYEIVDRGDRKMRVDSDGDWVKIISTCTFLNAKGIIYEDTINKVGNFIKGFNEGIRLIGKGGIIKLWVHPGLGHGPTWATHYTPNIPPNTALSFEVKLLRVSDYRLHYDSE